MAGRGDAIFQRGKSWFLDAQIKGIRYQRLLGKGISRSVALECAAVFRADVVRGEFGLVKKQDVTFDEARVHFEAWMTDNTRPNTAKSYRECLRRLAESFSGKRLSQISTFACEKHKQDRIAAGACVRVNRELAVLKAVYNRCLEWKLFDGINPVNGVKMIKEPRRRLRFLEPDEEDRLLAECDEGLRALILVGIYCGLRLASEALTLKWADLDLARKTVTVQAAYAKNGKTRTVPLHSRVVAVLAARPRTGEFVFVKSDGTPYTSVRNGFEAACRRANLIDVTPHTLRHTFATRLIENGTDLRMVMELGGWSSLALLQRYGHVSPIRKAEAIEKGFARHVPVIPLPAGLRRIGDTA